MAVQSIDKPDLHTRASQHTGKTLHVLHRIDQPASGLVLFAKEPRAAAFISQQLASQEVKRVYYCAVRTRPPHDQARLVHDLLRDPKRNKSFVVPQQRSKSKRAELLYRVVDESQHYVLLEVVLETGRHHQIRAQLGHMGSPIKGDVKYGARRANPDRSIHLHAFTMTLTLPYEQTRITLRASFPEERLWQYFAGRLPT